MKNIQADAPLQQSDPSLILTEKENELIRRTFKDNDELLKTMRAVFFGFETTAAEREILKKTFASPDLREIVWKKFLPSLRKDAPIGQIGDSLLGTEQMIFGASRDAIAQAVQYKIASIKMVKQALDLLENPDQKQMSLDFDASFEADPLQIGLLTRNQYIRHMEQQLVFLKVIAMSPAPQKLEKSTAKRNDSAQ